MCKIEAYSEDGILLETTTTDSLGNFAFNNLSSENSYKFTADTQVTLLMTLYDRYGKEIARIQEEENQFYIYRPFGYQTETNLSLTDDTIDFDLNLSSNYEAVLVFFETNQTAVKSLDLYKIAMVLKLLKKYPELNLSISAYTDATASDEYNFMLSQKRGEWIASYLINEGIDPNRLTINAYGETKLLDPENDEINRRAELRIYL
jgi:outer membrane protein OmpA-like peptidoglycan-associated protein